MPTAVLGAVFARRAALAALQQGLADGSRFRGRGCPFPATLPPGLLPGSRTLVRVHGRIRGPEVARARLPRGSAPCGVSLSSGPCTRERGGPEAPVPADAARLGAEAAAPPTNARLEAVTLPRPFRPPFSLQPRPVRRSLCSRDPDLGRPSAVPRAGRQGAPPPAAAGGPAAPLGAFVPRSLHSEAARGEDPQSVGLRAGPGEDVRRGVVGWPRPWKQGLVPGVGAPTSRGPHFPLSWMERGLGACGEAR